MKLIAAIGKNNELGKDNDLIWKIPEDMKYFHDQTMGAYVVMGRKTYESIPNKLEGRKRIVFSQTLESLEEDIIIMPSIDKFLEWAKGQKEAIYVIGGAKVYSHLLPYCNTLLLTEIQSTFAGADTYFPDFDKSEWEVTKGEILIENGIKYSHNIYKRKQINKL